MFRLIKKIIVLALIFCFVFEQTGFAQVAAPMGIPAYLSGFSIPDKFRPVHLRYLSYDPIANNFDLLLDKGDAKDLKQNQIEETTQELLKYFQIGITLPNKSFWVNLRPDGENDVIDPLVEKTDLGKVLLEADLQLKKDMAKCTSPDTAEGRQYWDKLYQKAGSLFGGMEVSIPTFTRPWIVPGEIIIRETGESAYIYKATLKVMLEQDYLKSSAEYSFDDERLKILNDYSSQLIRQQVIPKLTKMVNSSKQYAPLRQVYYSLILAQWFKQKFHGKEGICSSRIDKMDLSDLGSKTKWSKSTYFKAYQKSFKNGEYNLSESVYNSYGQTIRSYVSGGLMLDVSSYMENAITVAGQTAQLIASRALGYLSLKVNGSNIIISPSSLPRTEASAPSKVEEQTRDRGIIKTFLSLIPRALIRMKYLDGILWKYSYRILWKYNYGILWNNSPDLKKLKKWVEAHDEKLRELAQFIADGIISSYIGYDKFLDGLRETAKEFANSIGDKPYIAYIPGGTEKSTDWVFRIVQGEIPKPAHTVQIATGATPEKEKKHLSKILQENEDIKDIVIVDDAAYSGERLAVWIRDICIAAAFASQEITIHLVVPFMTKYAQATIEEAARHNIKVVVHSYKPIKTINDFLEEAEPEKRERLVALLSSAYEIDQTSITWKTFAYHIGKIPTGPTDLRTRPIKDRTHTEYGIFHSVFEGAVIRLRDADELQLITKIRFVPVTPEPYKPWYLARLFGEALREPWRLSFFAPLSRAPAAQKDGGDYETAVKLFKEMTAILRDMPHPSIVPVGDVEGLYGKLKPILANVNESMSLSEAHFFLIEKLIPLMAERYAEAASAESVKETLSSISDLAKPNNLSREEREKVKSLFGGVTDQTLRETLVEILPNSRKWLNVFYNAFKNKDQTAGKRQIQSLTTAGQRQSRILDKVSALKAVNEGVIAPSPIGEEFKVTVHEADGFVGNDPYLKSQIVRGINAGILVVIENTWANKMPEGKVKTYIINEIQYAENKTEKDMLELIESAQPQSVRAAVASNKPGRLDKEAQQAKVRDPQTNIRSVDKGLYVINGQVKDEYSEEMILQGIVYDIVEVIEKQVVRKVGGIEKPYIYYEMHYVAGRNEKDMELLERFLSLKQAPEQIKKNVAQRLLAKLEAIDRVSGLFLTQKQLFNPTPEEVMGFHKSLTSIYTGIYFSQEPKQQNDLLVFRNNINAILQWWAKLGYFEEIEATSLGFKRGDWYLGDNNVAMIAGPSENKEYMPIRSGYGLTEGAIRLQPGLRVVVHRFSEEIGGNPRTQKDGGNSSAVGTIAADEVKEAIKRVQASNNYSKFIFAVMTIAPGAIAYYLWLNNELNLSTISTVLLQANLILTAFALGYGLLHLAVSAATNRTALKISGGNPLQTHFWPIMILSNALDGVLDMPEILRNPYSFPKNAGRTMAMPAGLITTAGMLLIDAVIDFLVPNSNRLNADIMALKTALKYASGIDPRKQLNAVFHRYVYVESLPESSPQEKAKKDFLRLIIFLEMLRYHLNLEQNGILEDTHESNIHLDDMGFFFILMREGVLDKAMSSGTLSAFLEKAREVAPNDPIIRSTPFNDKRELENSMIEEYLEYMRDIYVYINEYPDQLQHFVPEHGMPLYKLLYEQYGVKRYVTFELLWLIDKAETSPLSQDTIDAMLRVGIIEAAGENSYQLTEDFLKDLYSLYEPVADSQLKDISEEKGILFVNGKAYRLRSSGAQPVVNKDGSYAQKDDGNNSAAGTIAAVQSVNGKTAVFSPEAWKQREEILAYSREHDVEVVIYGLGEFRDGILWIREMVQPDRIIRVQHDDIRTADLKAVLPILILDKLLKQAIVYSSFTGVEENAYYRQRIREYAQQKGLQVLYHMHTHVLKKQVPGTPIIKNLSPGDVIFIQKLRDWEFARNFNGEDLFIHEGAIQWDELVLVEEEGNRGLFADLPLERSDYWQRERVLSENFEGWFADNFGEIFFGPAAEAWAEDWLTQRMKQADKDAEAETKAHSAAVLTDGSAQTDGGNFVTLKAKESHSFTIEEGVPATLVIKRAGQVAEQVVELVLDLKDNTLFFKRPTDKKDWKAVKIGEPYTYERIQEWISISLALLPGGKVQITNNFDEVGLDFIPNLLYKLRKDYEGFYSFKKSLTPERISERLIDPQFSSLIQGNSQKLSDILFAKEYRDQIAKERVLNNRVLFPGIMDRGGRIIGLGTDRAAGLTENAQEIAPFYVAVNIFNGELELLRVEQAVQDWEEAIITLEASVAQTNRTMLEKTNKQLAGSSDGGASQTDGELRHVNKVSVGTFTLEKDFGAEGINLVELLTEILKKDIGIESPLVSVIGSAVYTSVDGKINWDIITDVDIRVYLDRQFTRPKKEVVAEARMKLKERLSSAGIRVFDTPGELESWGVVDNKGRQFPINVQFAYQDELFPDSDKGNFFAYRLHDFFYGDIDTLNRILNNSGEEAILEQSVAFYKRMFNEAKDYLGKTYISAFSPAKPFLILSQLAYLNGATDKFNNLRSLRSFKDLEDFKKQLIKQLEEPIFHLSDGALKNLLKEKYTSQMQQRDGGEGIRIRDIEKVDDSMINFIIPDKTNSVELAIDRIMRFIVFDLVLAQEQSFSREYLETVLKDAMNYAQNGWLKEKDGYRTVVNSKAWNTFPAALKRNFNEAQGKAGIGEFLISIGEKRRAELENALYGHLKDWLAQELEDVRTKVAQTYNDEGIDNYLYADLKELPSAKTIPDFHNIISESAAFLNRQDLQERLKSYVKIGKEIERLAERALGIFAIGLNNLRGPFKDVADARDWLLSEPGSYSDGTNRQWWSEQMYKYEEYAAALFVAQKLRGNPEFRNWASQFINHRFDNGYITMGGNAYQVLAADKAAMDIAKNIIAENLLGGSENLESEASAEAQTDGGAGQPAAQEGGSIKLDSVLSGSDKARDIQINRVSASEKIAAIINAYDLGVSKWTEVQYSYLPGFPTRPPLKLKTPKGEVVLKYMGGDLDKSILTITEILYLQNQEIPIPPLWIRRDADPLYPESYLVKIEGTYYYLESFVKGTQVDLKTANEEHLFALGGLLAKMHNLTRNLENQSSWQSKPITDILHIKDELVALKEMLTKKETKFQRGENAFLEISDRLLSSIEIAKQRLPEDWYLRLPRYFIHRDVSFPNVMFNENNQINAIFDWERASLLPKLNDFANPVLNPGSNAGRYYKRQNFIDIVAAYQYYAETPLKNEELVVLPEILRLTFLWNFAGTFLLEREKLEDDNEYARFQYTREAFIHFEEEFPGNDESLKKFTEEIIQRQKYIERIRRAGDRAKIGSGQQTQTDGGGALDGGKITTEVYQKDIESARVAGNIKEHKEDAERDIMAPIDTGLALYNTRRLYPNGQVLLRKILLDERNSLETLVVGPGIGNECWDIYNIATKASKKVTVDTVGLTPLAPRIRLTKNLAQIKFDLIEYLRKNPNSKLEGLETYLDRRFFGSEAGEIAEAVKVASVAFPFNLLADLQNKGRYRIFDILKSPYINNQYIGRLNGVAIDKTYDFIYDNYGGFFYSVQHEGFQTTIEKTAQLLNREGILYVGYLPGDALKKLSAVKLSEQFVLVAFERHSGIVVLRKESELAGRISKLLAKSINFNEGMYLIADFNALLESMIRNSRANQQKRDGGDKESYGKNEIFRANVEMMDEAGLVVYDRLNKAIARIYKSPVARIEEEVEKKIIYIEIFRDIEEIRNNPELVHNLIKLGAASESGMDLTGQNIKDIIDVGYVGYIEENNLIVANFINSDKNTFKLVLPLGKGIYDYRDIPVSYRIGAREIIRFKRPSVPIKFAGRENPWKLNLNTLYDRLTALKDKSLSAKDQTPLSSGKEELDGGQDSKETETSDKGGIDFRQLPIVTQPAASGPQPVVIGPAMQMSEGSLNEEWKQIEKTMQNGPMPYQKIKEYVTCCRNQKAEKQMDAVFACIANILRLEEEQALPTAPEIKEILVSIG